MKESCLCDKLLLEECRPNTQPREGITKNKEGKLASEICPPAKAHCQARKPTDSTTNLELGASYGEWRFWRQGHALGTSVGW